MLSDHSLHRVLGRHEQGARAGAIHRGDIVEPALGSTQAAPALVQPARRFGLHRRRTFRTAWAAASGSSTASYPPGAVDDGFRFGPPQHRIHTHPTPPHRRPPGVHDRRLRRLLPLPHHLPDPPRPGGLSALPRRGVAAPRLPGLLVPHIVLAALVVPLALTTIHRAWRGRFDRHRRLARLTLPIWL